MGKWTRDGILAKHAGHRCTVIDERSLRCLDCAHTLLLDVGRETLDGPRATPTAPMTGTTDEYGRQPCYRCSKLVGHTKLDGGLLEPLPHAVKGDPTAKPCTSPSAPPASLPPGGWRALVAQLEATA